MSLLGLELLSSMNREMIVPFPTPDGPHMTKGCIGTVLVCWLLAFKEEDENERACREEVLG